MRKCTLLTAAVLLAFGSPSAATIVFNNGAPNSSGGVIITPGPSGISADDFALSSATNITGAGVYIGNTSIGTAVSPTLSSFTYSIYASSSGLPAALLASGNVIPTSITNTGLPWTSTIPRDAYLLTFDLNSPFAAAAGTTYWFGLSFTPPVGAGIWAQSNSHGNSALNLSPPPFLAGNWVPENVELAFYLDASAASVPESSTWAMMLLGFGAVGMALRRTRRPKVAAVRIRDLYFQGDES